MRWILICLALGFISCSLQAAPVPGVVVCHFDTDDLQATVNYFGDLKPQFHGFFAGPEGSGCPAAPDGRALDAGYTSPVGQFVLPVWSGPVWGQGTLEFWFRPNWDFGDRAIRSIAALPLVGGQWNSISVCYHGLMGTDYEVFESNIMDGLDHPLVVEVSDTGLMWKRGEWHHIALTWTEHSQRFFGDGKLLGEATYSEPLNITAPTGRLVIGFPFSGMGEIAASMIDELRLCNLPLYAGMNEIPVPDAPYPDDLPDGLALVTDGATIEVDGEAPPLRTEADVPELHDGIYGKALRIGLNPDTGDATITLAQEAEVSGLVWSRDGRPFAGPDGQGWAWADSLPRDYQVEISMDGQTWEAVANVKKFKIIPRELETMTAARFTVNFSSCQAKFVRFRVDGDTTAKLGHWPLLDEITVLDKAGQPVPVTMISTERTRFERDFAAANVIDGHIGEESCWKSNRLNGGQVTVRFPAVKTIQNISWSRNREGLATEGLPQSVRVETSENGTDFTQVGQQDDINNPKTVSVEFAPRQVLAFRLTVLATTDGKEAVIDEIQAQ